INYQLSTINYQLSTTNYQLSTTNYQLPTTSSRIHIHTPRQKRGRIVDVQRFADEEGFTAFDADHRPEIPIARLDLAQKSLLADPGWRLRCWGIKKLRGVRGDRFPFLFERFADVYDKPRLYSSRKEKITHAVRPPTLQPRLSIVFREAGDM